MSLLAKIGGSDLIGIEAKYHFKCLSAYRNIYRSSQRAKKDCTVDRFSSNLKSKIFVQCGQHIYKPRLKQHLFTHYSQRCQEQSDGKATLLVPIGYDYIFGELRCENVNNSSNVT